MIGNDVVDLRSASVQSNWRRKGFLEKVFHPAEQELISSSEEQHQMVWLLWSMKEAAYKAHQRRFLLPRSLNWKILLCSSIKFPNEDAAQGVVKIRNEFYFTRSDISSISVHTTALAHKKLPFRSKLLKASAGEMKTSFFEEISCLLDLPQQNFSIVKNNHGIPFVSQKEHRFLHPFSFSGHGGFSAFSLSLMIP